MIMTPPALAERHWQECQRLLLSPQNRAERRDLIGVIWMSRDYIQKRTARTAKFGITLEDPNPLCNLCDSFGSQKMRKGPERPRLQLMHIHVCCYEPFLLLEVITSLLLRKLKVLAAYVDI